MEDFNKWIWKGSLLDIKKVREKGGEKEKEKEKEKLVAKPMSPIQIINLDGNTNPMDGQEQYASQQGDTFSLLVTKVASFLVAYQRKKNPLIPRKLFNPTTL